MSGEFTEKIKNIYKYLGDRESKEIYSNRLMYSLTDDYEYIVSIVKNTELYRKLWCIFRNDSRQKYIFGAGTWGKQIAELYREFEFAGYIDSHIKGQYKGWSIISLGEYLKKKRDETIYISSTKYHAEQYMQLISAGIREENIVDIGKMMLKVWDECQYFDLSELKFKKGQNEVFVDGGCYDGANSVRFAKWADGNGRIWAFEPDMENIKRCEDRFRTEHIGQYKLINKGLWSRETRLCFENVSDEGSCFRDGGKTTVPVTSLDEAVNGKVTFIKLDIEGAEYEALSGAKRIISEFKPKIAVSVYHKREDIWELPELIIKINPQYKFFLRHYSLDRVETVLYAI